MNEALESVFRYTLVVLLVLSFLGSVCVSFINPESYLFGKQLSGETATLHLLAEGFARMAIALLLFKKRSEGKILSALYFAYLFIEVSWTNLSLGFGLLIPPLPTAGLTVSAALLVVSKMK